MSLVPVVALCVLALLGGIGCWLDFRYRQLPNWLCLLALTTGLFFTFLSDGWIGVGLAGAHAMVALLFGMVLFASGLFGGGDAKYYAGLAGWFPITQALFLLVSVALSGLILTLIMLLSLRKRSRANLGVLGGKTDNAFDKVPYGVAIAIGALMSGIYFMPHM